jgi:hypothetical protein
MADEATIRIVLDQGTGPGSTLTGGSASTVVQPPPRPQPATPRQPTPAGRSRTPDAPEGLADIAQKYRGLLSRVFGTFVGTILDLVLSVRRAMPEIPTVYPAIDREEGQQTVPKSPSPQMPSQAQAARPPSSLAPFGTASARPLQGRSFSDVQPKQFNTNVAAGASTGVAVAGAAAIAVAAFEAVKLIKNNLYSGITGVGRLGASAISANADPSQSLMALGGAAKSASDAIFILNPPLSILGNVAAATTQSLASLMQALDGVVDRYKGLSGPLATATTQSEITQALGDVRRAQEVGPQLAQYVNARSDLQQNVEDTKIKLLEHMVPLVTKLVENIDKLWPVIEFAVDTNVRVVEALVGPILLAINGLAALMPEKPRPERPVTPTEAMLQGFPWGTRGEGGFESTAGGGGIG